MTYDKGDHEKESKKTENFSFIIEMVSCSHEGSYQGRVHLNYVDTHYLYHPRLAKIILMNQKDETKKKKHGGLKGNREQGQSMLAER